MAVSTILFGIETASVLLRVFLLLVSGSLSLLYLWPLIRDGDQRPRTDKTSYGRNTRHTTSGRNNVVADFSSLNTR